MEIGFIGLGSMGLPMARNLLADGHDLTVFNRTRSRTGELSSSEVTVASSPEAVADNVPVVVTMVSDDQAVNEVVFGDQNGSVDEGNGVINHIGPGDIHLVCSTISPDLAKRLHSAHDDSGSTYLSAPVFGKPNFAREGTLSVVTAGPAEAIKECEPIFESIGRQYFVVGESPHKANVVKLAGNFTIAAMMETLGESFALMKKADIDARQFLDVINGSLFDSPLYEAYGETIATKDYQSPGFKLELGLKDMRLAQQVAEENEAPMPLLSLVHDNLLAAVASDMEEFDWAALGEISYRQAGLSNDSTQTGGSDND